MSYWMKCARGRSNERDKCSAPSSLDKCVLNSYFDPIRLGLPCDSHTAAFVWSRNFIVARGGTTIRHSRWFRCSSTFNTERNVNVCPRLFYAEIYSSSNIKFIHQFCVTGNYHRKSSIILNREQIVRIGHMTQLKKILLSYW